MFCTHNGTGAQRGQQVFLGEVNFEFTWTFYCGDIYWVRSCCGEVAGRSRLVRHGTDSKRFAKAIPAPLTCIVIRFLSHTSTARGTAMIFRGLRRRWPRAASADPAKRSAFFVRTRSQIWWSAVVQHLGLYVRDQQILRISNIWTQIVIFRLLNYY